jgi:hypothetical protein
MVPNLFVATRTLVSPHRWFVSKHRSDGQNKASLRTTEHWDSPVPGLYEYKPGRGWYLIGTDESQHSEPKYPIPVVYSKVLKRYLFTSDYEDRRRRAKVKLHEVPSRNGSIKTIATEEGKAPPVAEIDAPVPGKKSRSSSNAVPQTRTVVKDSIFFRLDDGVTWVRCWDELGDFIPGPYERWCIDQKSGSFRKMLKGDDPDWQQRHSSSRSTHRALQKALTGTTVAASANSGSVTGGSNASQPASAVQSRSQSAAASPRNSSHLARSPLSSERLPYQAINVLDLPSRSSTRPPSPASHMYKTPLEGPTSPTLSERLKEVAAAKAA